MKSKIIFYIIILISIYSFESPRKMDTNIAEYSNVEFNNIQIDCRRKLNETFAWTINKKEVVIHGGQYCQDMCDFIFTDDCKIDINTKIDLALALFFFQGRHISTTYFYSTFKQMNDVNYSLLMLFAPFRGNPDSLLNITPNKNFLNNLDSNHLDFVLKTDSLIKNKTNRLKLENDYSDLILKTICRDWFLNKYKKYFVNWY